MSMNKRIVTTIILSAVFIAGLRSLDKTYSKIIRMKRSEKTGAYYFDEIVVPADKVQEYLAKR